MIKFYKEFSLKKKEECFESSFQRCSTTINSTIAFCVCWNYQFSGLRSEVQKPKHIFQPPSENMKLSSETVILQIQLVVLAGKEFDKKEKPQQIAPFATFGL